MPYGIQTNLTSLPPWYEALYRNLGEKAAAQAKAPYAAYKSPRIAPFSPDMTRSFDMTRGSMGAYLPYLEQARIRTNAATTEFPQVANQYMNPYAQNVLDRIRNESGQFLNEKILPSLESHFVSSGAPRSGQHLRMVGQAGRDVQRDMEERQRAYLAQAYDQAGKNFASDYARKLQSGENMARLGQVAQAGNIADVAALQEQGRLQQQQKQGELDVPYQDFLRQQNYPWEQLGQQSAIMHGIPAPTQTTGVVQTPGQPQVNTLGGLGSLAGSLYGARMFAGKKRGGHITGVSLPKATKPPKVRKPPVPSFGLSTLRFKPKSSKNLIRGRR